MRKIVGMCVIFAILVTNAYGYGDNETQEYVLEFAWQKSLAEKKKKNIKDYFLLLPTDFLDCEHMRDFDERFAYSTKERREELITKVDLKNGYLEFGGPQSQLAIFKDVTSKKDIIAVQIGGCGAGNTCGAINALMQLEGATWKFRVDLLPQGKTLEELYYEELRTDAVCPYFDLPQYGTTILVRNECLVNECKPRAVVARYLWSGERFVIEE